MNFLADMGISPSIINQLVTDGHNAIHIASEGMARASDHLILEKARKENRILLTHDLDFTDIMAASKDSLPSIILFRLNNMRPENVYYFLSKIIISHEELLKQGIIVSVNEARIRVRQLPVE